MATTNYCFCVKYFDPVYTCQIHEKNFYMRTDNPEAYLRKVENHVAKRDDFGELFVSFYQKVVY